MNGRKARALKAQKKAEDERLIESIRDAHPVLLRRDGEMEEWQKGPLTLWVPVVRDDYPPALKVGLQLRRTSIFELECMCGAEVRVSASRRIALRHLVSCPASGEALEPLAQAAGIATERADG
ncbi:hypothetical protein OG967_39875 [Streptomyces phaeochromogenes]